MSSQQTKPTVIDLWFKHRFITQQVSYHANVSEQTIERMKKSEPVEREQAIQVLEYLKDRYREEYSLDTVHVPLITPNPHRSELALLMQQIDEEFTASKGALTGLSAGSSKHEYITARMNHIGGRMMELAATYGENTIIEVLVEWQNGLVEESQPSQQA